MPAENMMPALGYTALRILLKLTANSVIIVTGLTFLLSGCVVPQGHCKPDAARLADARMATATIATAARSPSFADDDRSPPTGFDGATDRGSQWSGIEPQDVGDREIYAQSGWTEPLRLDAYARRECARLFLGRRRPAFASRNLSYINDCQKLHASLQPDGLSVMINDTSTSGGDYG